MTLVVPFPGGGPADIFGRNLAERMSPSARPAGAGREQERARGRHRHRLRRQGRTDAHVMGLMSASAGAIMQSLMPKMPFDPAKDIAPQILVVRVQEVFAINSKLGINDLKSFIAHAKANPGKVTCGSAGTGGITHLAIELFKRETGTDLLHVPYRGAAPATNDLLAGTVDTVLLDISVLLAACPLGRHQGAGGDVGHPRRRSCPTCRPCARWAIPRSIPTTGMRWSRPAPRCWSSARRSSTPRAAALKTKELAEAYAKSAA
jgi:hypothetical protein